MSHHFKVEPIPHINKDGSPSKSKIDGYRVIDRTRSGRKVVGFETNAKAAEMALKTARVNAIEAHLKNHPNDLAFKKKHGIES